MSQKIKEIDTAISVLFSRGKKIKEAANLLKEKNKLEIPFDLLVSTSLELFLKVIRSSQERQQFKNNSSADKHKDIFKTLKDENHDIQELIKKANIKEKCNIKTKEASSGKEWIITFNKKDIRIKKLESLRYGLLASHQDTGTFPVADQEEKNEIIKFLKCVEEEDELKLNK